MNPIAQDFFGKPCRWHMRGLYWSHDGIANEVEGRMDVLPSETEWYLRVETWSAETAAIWEAWMAPWPAGRSRNFTWARSTLFGPNEGVLWMREDGFLWRYRIPTVGMMASDLYLPQPDGSWRMVGQMGQRGQPMSSYDWLYTREA